MSKERKTGMPPELGMPYRPQRKPDTSLRDFGWLLFMSLLLGGMILWSDIDKGGSELRGLLAIYNAR